MDYGTKICKISVSTMDAGSGYYFEDNVDCSGDTESESEAE